MGGAEGEGWEGQRVRDGRDLFKRGGVREGEGRGGRSREKRWEEQRRGVGGAEGEGWEGHRVRGGRGRG